MDKAVMQPPLHPVGGPDYRPVVTLNGWSLPFRNGGYGTGSHGNGGYGNPSRIAQQNGYRDGVNDGRNDRATGHSFRPTHDDNYKNAPGYSSSMAR